MVISSAENSKTKDAAFSLMEDLLVKRYRGAVRSAAGRCLFANVHWSVITVFCHYLDQALRDY
jgi:hypothetical protein